MAFRTGHPRLSGTATAARGVAGSAGNVASAASISSSIDQTWSMIPSENSGLDGAAGPGAQWITSKQ